MQKPIVRHLLFFAVLFAAVAVLYWPSLDSGLLFDDNRLQDGTIFGSYGSFLPLKIRALSYGSFVWVNALFAEDWWKQRLVNVFFHIATVAVIFKFCLQILSATNFPSDATQSANFGERQLLGLKIGIGVFALNPVAVYAVAYLAQRSILMATFFAVVTCVFFVHGLLLRRPLWFTLAAICFFCAVLSKEHAVGLIFMLLPIYVFIQRPPKKKLIIGGVLIGLVFVLVVLALWPVYSNIFGKIFDDVSHAHAGQLEMLAPGVKKNLYVLSIFNEVENFFRYGFFWIIPVIGWMSIDMHPEFPISFINPSIVLSIFLYVTLAFCSLYFVLRRSDIYGLIGLCFLWPCFLFVSEFSTVWLQDPFVLYRSYIWAVTIPILLTLGLSYFPKRFLIPFGIFLVFTYAGLAFERVQSLRSPLSAWSDAAEKVVLNAPLNAIGRWRPFQNLGAEQLAREDWELAYQSFSNATRLGEPFGSARFSLGMILQKSGKFEEALNQFTLAENQGFAESSLHFHRAEVLTNLDRRLEANESFNLAINTSSNSEMLKLARQKKSENSLIIQNYSEAEKEYIILLKDNPYSERYLSGLSLSYLGQKRYDEALKTIDVVIGKKPSAQAFYSKAFILFKKEDYDLSRQLLNDALRLDPENINSQNLIIALNQKKSPKRNK